jgi:hypothetical protein
VAGLLEALGRVGTDVTGAAGDEDVHSNALLCLLGPISGLRVGSIRTGAGIGIGR